MSLQTNPEVCCLDGSTSCQSVIGKNHLAETTGVWHHFQQQQKSVNFPIQAREATNWPEPEH